MQCVSAVMLPKFQGPRTPIPGLSGLPHTYLHWLKSDFGGFPGGAVVENLPANAGDTGSSPGLGGSHMPRSN